MARLWLTVNEEHDGPGYGYPYELWWRDVDLEGVPEEGDSVMLLRSDEEPDGSVMHEIKRRYWSYGGTLNLELRGIVHLPNEKYEEDFIRMTQRAAQTRDWGQFYRQAPTPWREEDDHYSALTDRLVESGWRRFAELD